MITEQDNVFYCDCGFSFERGRSGAHNCEIGLRKKLAESEAKLAALAAENSAMKQIIESVTDLNNEPQYHAEGMGCGLEDRDITDRYDACRYGWGEAMERIYGEVIPCAEEIAFPATDAFLAEVRAEAFNDLCVALVKNATVAGLDDGDTVTVKEVTDALLHCAEQLCKGVQS